MGSGTVGGIELIHSEDEDGAFLSLIERIVNGAVATLQMREVYLVRIDNWFDWKWLGWRSWKGKELKVPPFDPNRVRSEEHFLWDVNSSRWASIPQRRPLHVRQPGRDSLAQPLDRFSKSAAFIWYSGNSVTNKAGSLMLYLSGADRYAWYVSFTKKEQWIVEGERQISRRELTAFEQCGRKVFPVPREFDSECGQLE